MDDGEVIPEKVALRHNDSDLEVIEAADHSEDFEEVVCYNEVVQNKKKKRVQADDTVLNNTMLDGYYDAESTKKFTTIMDPAMPGDSGMESEGGSSRRGVDTRASGVIGE